VTFGATYANSINPSGDVDWYQFSLAAPEIVSINLEHSAGFDFDFILYDSTGAWKVWSQGASFSVPLNPGNYRLAACSYGSRATGSYSFSLIKGEVLRIGAFAGSHGTITPSGDRYVSPGGSITFHAVPDDGYIVDRWYVDGEDVTGSIDGLMLENVNRNRVVQVTFKLDVGEGTLTHDGPWSATQGESFAIEGYLRDGLGNGISGSAVYAKIGGSTIGGALTDGSGYYQIAIADAPDTVGQHTVSLQAVHQGRTITASGSLTVLTSTVTRYDIRTAEEFLYYMTNPDYYNQRFRLMNDISLSGKGDNADGSFSRAIVAPNPNVPFTGRFDGQGYRIRQIRIDTKGASTDYLGLFGKIGPGGRVLNLNLTSGVSIQAGDGSSYVGGIAGYVDDGYIVNCRISGNSIEVGKNSSHIGRLAGYVYRTLVVNCSVEGSVSAGANAFCVGGLVGDSYHGTDFRDCSATGNVRVGTNSQYTGGLIGRATKSTIENSYTTTGWLEGAEDSKYLGGLVGATYDCVIRRCYSTRTVRSSAENDYMSHVGGLIGYHTDYSEVIECYSTGTINAPDSDYVGGLTGYNYDGAKIRRSFNTGPVVAYGSVGGLTGKNHKNSLIVDSYSRGTVTGTSDVGGITGENWDRSTIENCYSIGPVAGSSRAGGITGDSWQSVVNTSYFLCTFAPENGYGTALTDSEMRQQANYAGWDFSKTWYVNEEVEYPDLRWTGVRVSPPAWVTASDSYTNYVLIEWAPVAAGGFYNVYRSPSEVGAKTELSGWTDSLSYVDAAADPGVTYYYWVRAATDWSGAGVSDFSDSCVGQRVSVAEVNNPPSTPAGMLPMDGATGVSTTPTLESSDFFDPNPGDTHSGSHWQISTSPDFTALVWNIGETWTDKTQTTVPLGHLEYGTMYYWRVRHRDSSGALNPWSEWSDAGSFTTEEWLYSSTADGAWINYWYDGPGEWSDPWSNTIDHPYIVHNGPAYVGGRVADTGLKKIEVQMGNPGGEAGLTGSIWLYGEDGWWDFPDEYGYPPESCGQAWGKVSGRFTLSAYPAGTAVVLDLSVSVEGELAGDAEDYYFRILRGESLLAEILVGGASTAVIATGGEDLTYEMYAMADDFQANPSEISYDRVFTFQISVTPDNADGDGVGAGEEAGPGGDNLAYDGNGDGTPDWLQDSVASFHAITEDYITVACAGEGALSNVAALDNPSAMDTPPGMEAPYGYFEFSILDVTPGGAVIVEMYVPDGSIINSYYKYGPTPDDPTAHWYEFMFDGQTGAVIVGNVIRLHFVDGLRGDDDLTANGVIVEPGAPVTTDGNPPAAPMITEVTDDTGTAGDGITSDNTLILSGTAEGNSTVTVYRDGSSIGATTADDSGSWIFDYTGTSLADGRYSFTAVAADAAGNMSVPSLPFVVEVSRNMPPTDFGLSPASVTENAPSGTVVGTFTATDPDMGDSHVYSLISGVGDDDNGSFEVNGSQLKTTASFDFETRSSYSIRVQADDGQGGTFEKVFAIGITDVNEQPDAPTCNRPTGGAMDVVLTPVLESSGFQDPEAGNTHAATQWQVDDNADFSSPVWDYEDTDSDMTAQAVPSGVLLYGTTYHWRVRHQDSGGAWSEWSVAAQFTTMELPPDLVVSGDLVVVTEGSRLADQFGRTFEFYVKLAAQPGADVTVNVAWLGGDGDITVSNGSALVFTAANWDAWQAVALVAAEDADTTNGTATIRCSVPGGSHTDITAQELDNDIAQPVYRFWSPVVSHHFYTMNEAERNTLIDNYSHVWTYECVAYYAYADDTQAGTAAIYRFWSPIASSHFYTMSEAERDTLINEWSHAWTYEGVAYFAYPESSAPMGSRAVHRFWSPVLSGHFYTMEEAEKDWIIATYPSSVWTYEGIAWYALPSASIVPTEVNSLLSISLGSAIYDLGMGVTSGLLTIQNSSQAAIGGSLWVVITSITDPGVTLAAGSGTTVDGYQYIDVTDLLADGRLDPGEEISQWLDFDNPLRLRFEFTYSIRGVI